MLLLLAFVIAIAVEAKYCQPVDLIMTRASGQEATFANGTWTTEYPLDSVNAASLQGALQFIIMETIDKKEVMIFASVRTMLILSISIV